MSGVPPSQPGGQPPSQGGKGEPTSKSNKEQKAFELQKEQEKKMQQLEAADQEGQQIQQQIDQRVEQSSVQATEKAASIQTTQVKQVAQIIQRNVESMRIGEVNGQTTASATLQGPEIPEAFAGSNLNLSYTDRGLDINFDNMTPDQELQAMQMIAQNRDQLHEMVMNLQAKNITVHQMTIGSNVVALPRIEPVQPSPPPSTEAQTQQDRQQQQDEGTTDPDR